MPARKFLGVVLQGDSLRILLDSAEEIHELSTFSQNFELSAAAALLKEQLAGYIAAYEQAMKEAGVNSHIQN